MTQVERDSQERNGEKKTNAKDGGAKKRERKGLDYMGSRLEIVVKRHQLQKSRDITPTESMLLEKIQIGTVGAQNKRGEISSKNEFYLIHLAQYLQVKMNKLYVMLKRLETKGLIVRHPTMSKGLEVLGLNPAAFGRILPERQHEDEQKRFLKLVVSNPEVGGDNFPPEVPTQDQDSPKSGPMKSGSGTNPVLNQDQIEHEKPAYTSLDPSISSSDGKKRGDTYVSPEEVEAAKNTAKKEIGAIMGLIRNMPR